MPARIIQADVPRAEVKVDAITLDIIENALQNARTEMEHVVFRAAMSTVIRDQRDAFPLITDRNGSMVVGQFGSPVAGFLRGYHGTVEDGDVLLTSDPYACQGAISHANDWLVIKPIYVDNRLVGWSGIFGHVTDIGGQVPGSEPINVSEIFEEGIVIPPLKICRNNEFQADLLELILHNCRVPQYNRADITALVASVSLAARRVIEICQRFGTDTYLQTCDLLLDRTKRAVAHLIETAIPDDTLYFEDYVCDDGLGFGPYRIACTMQKRDGKLFFDFSETDDQSPGSINFYFNDEMFKMFVGAYLIKIFDPQIIFNAGYYDLIELEIPEGSLLRPRRPAALSCRNATLMRTFDVLIGLLGQRTPKLMTAAGYSYAPYMFYSGRDAMAKLFTYFYAGMGGIPGRPVGDGHDASTLLPSMFNLPNEFSESYAPVIIDRFELVPDSGGPGLHRGGNGVLTVFQFLKEGDVSIHDCRWLTYPWGVNGGMPGLRGRKMMERADGTTEVLPAMIDRVPVKPGDRLHFISWGGGGWGNPLERDPALVALEVRRGLVTTDGARNYGVVLRADRSVDHEATASLRRQMAKSRDNTAIFDRGDDIAHLLERCLEETGLAPPKPPVRARKAVAPGVAA